MSEIEILRRKIDEYRRKVHVNSLIKGSLHFVILTAVVLTFASLLEHYFWFNSFVRMLLFYACVTGLLIFLWLWMIRPLAKATGILQSDLSDHLLAEQIGQFFPEVKDRLINALQLEKLSTSDNSLIIAGINSHLEKLKPIPFTSGVSYRVNLKYLRYVAFIMLSMVLFSFLIPGIYTNSTRRVIDFDSEYVKPMPFTFDVSYKNDFAFHGEPFTIKVKISGERIPVQVYLLSDNRKVFLNKVDDQNFQYTIENVKEDISFQLEAAGFMSRNYLIPAHNRAVLTEMSLDLYYPTHTGKSNETVGQGKLSIPEGTNVKWKLATKGTDQATLQIDDSLMIEFQNTGNQSFTANYPFTENSTYEILLKNQFGQNKEKIQYYVDVIPDAYPVVEATYYLDTILYDYIIISGEAMDDYGIRSLKVHAVEDDEVVYTEDIPRSSRETTMSYYQQLFIDSLYNLSDYNKPRSLYVTVTDNDVINGFKTSRSESFAVRLPQRESIDAQINLKAQETASGLEKSIEKANSINEKIKNLQERLLNKKSLEWQEEKLLNELLEQRKQIENEVRNLQEKFDQLNKAEEKFTGKSEEIQEKAKELQKLMEEVLDEETKKMYEELQRLMEENAGVEELQKQLDRLNSNENNLEKELERALELFKRLKVETELEQVSKKLEALSKEQESLAEKTGQRDDNGSKEQNDDLKENQNEDIISEQKDINEKYKEIQEQLENVQELNQELKNPEPLQDVSEELDDVEKGLKEAQDLLEQKQFEKGSEKQKNNSQKLQELSQKMSQMMQSMQMEMLSEDIDNLRNILDNLVKLSFRQEDLIDAFYEVRQVDPRFVELSQEQLKLKDDAKIIEDSLLALSQRVVQMSSFITREVALVNENVEAALTNLRERDRNKALSNQQFAMASINNLALLLDDLLQQMQNSMASGMSKGKPQNQKGEGLPNLKELQKNLSQQIKELQQGQKKGRQLSEQLAKMAAQQEMLREQLNELKNSMKGQPGGEEAGDAMEKAMKLMEQNEIDLVNKRLTQQLMDRQEEIITRMLDAENAMKEQEFDNERKGETADEIDRTIPKAFQEYLLERKKQIELQKTIPIGLNPFYKKEVNDYFRRLSTEN